MVSVKHLVLDVLKPHQPNALEFCRNIAAAGSELRVRLVVKEVDEHTETLQIEIDGADLDFEQIQNAISEQGGSLHSIDQVEVKGLPDEAATEE
ncbi:MAG: DUF211 domain-containing protein [Gammaproteobacteria bacterium]|nr:DUF211 domain-containing protein [Gammaproteobacteria bacterium]MBU1655545.1 DUF211 domain-containing protein [Gammaproteobacteria bacterium]MBU1961293.1 DUF211 domain-containing protein [Gammaproteobacteria bacterium]